MEEQFVSFINSRSYPCAGLALTYDGRVTWAHGGMGLQVSASQLSASALFESEDSASKLANHGLLIAQNHYVLLEHTHNRIVMVTESRKKTLVVYRTSFGTVIFAFEGQAVKGMHVKAVGDIEECVHRVLTM
jgi:hypothetical protein